MKIQPLLFLTLCWAFLFPHLVSAAPAKGKSLPAAVKAYLPKGATSFFAERLPLGYKGTTRFVHVWGLTRPKPPQSSNSYNAYAPSPFCIDVFEPTMGQGKRWTWHLVSSASYVSTDPPFDVVTHWLRPKTRQGPILEIVSSNGAPGVSTTHTIFVWDKGLQEGYTAPAPQTFDSGGSGGGMIGQRFDEVDARGYMTITQKESYNGEPTSTKVYSWDGERFANSAAE